MEVQRRKCKHRPRRNARRLVWLLDGGLVVKVVGSGMCIYTSISRRYPIFSRLSPAHASTSEKNGLVEAGGDLEDWRADHRVLVQQGQVVEATTNGGEAPAIRLNLRRPPERKGRPQPRVLTSRLQSEAGLADFVTVQGGGFPRGRAMKPRRFRSV